MMRFIVRRGVPVVSLTHAIKEILVADFYASQKKVINLHDGFDETLFHPRLNKPEARRKCAFSDDLYIIGYVGKFTTMGESKGVEKLIEAVRLLKDKRCMLLLVGDDERLLPVHNDINIAVIPHVPQSKLLPYLRSCDVVTMPFPRTPHYEKCMSPMKLFEYMASGVPVIATDLQSVREVVSNEDVLFIRDDSPQEIADAITSLRNNPAEAKSLADSALIKASQYTWYKRAESFIAFLSKP